jgi:hypothetical protein
MCRVFLPQFGGNMHGVHHATAIPPGNEDKLVFTVVRNPYDRLLSCWHHLRRHDEKFNIRNKTFPEFMALLEEHWGPDGKSQVEFLPKRMEWYLRYEKLADQVLGLPFNYAQHHWPEERQNEEERPGWRTELHANPHYVDLINEHSAPDFEAFEYPRW